MNNSNNEKYQHVNFLLLGADGENKLLQTYRIIRALIQLSLLTFAGILFVALYYFCINGSALACLGISFTIAFAWLFHYHSEKKFSEMILFRRLEVNWWHRSIVVAERQLPEEHRTFTKFKLAQKARRHDITNLKEALLQQKVPITSPLLDELLGTGSGATRKVIDHQIYNMIKLIWASILLFSLIIIVKYFILLF